MLQKYGVGMKTSDFVASASDIGPCATLSSFDALVLLSDTSERLSISDLSRSDPSSFHINYVIDTLNITHTVA